MREEIGYITPKLTQIGRLKVALLAARRRAQRAEHDATNIHRQYNQSKSTFQALILKLDALRKDLKF